MELEGLQLSVQLLVQQCGGVPAIYRQRLIGAQFCTNEDRAALAFDFAWLFGPGTTHSDFSTVFQVVSEVHGALGMHQYEAGTG